jgi:hypothetical protein
MSDDIILIKKKHVLERPGEELLLFDSSKGKLFEVNETGKIIWAMLDGKHRLKDITRRLIQKFDEVPQDDRDFTEFFNNLLKLELVEKK